MSGAREHLPLRPGWDCVVDGQPWPCDAKREQLLTEYRYLPTLLSLYLRSLREQASEELPGITAGELWERFGAWVPRRVAG